ncbi:MAG TPA: Hsp20/alpha crystallin family protein [Thermomicrobiales bacterium]|nr:Hsp20/alpha crystallin family protein [Thermomicrobiales bacterium]
MYVHIVPTTFAPREDAWHRTEDNLALMDQLFAERFVRPGAARPNPYALPVNAYVAGEEFTVEALLPGISPEDVRVTLERGVLTLAATRHGPTPASAPDGQTWYAYEFAPGAFSRALRLPFPVADEGVTAAFAHGLLTITAPKAAAARAQTIPIGGGQPRAQLPAPATD